MAEVKTIDIDGIQWSMKDETARNTLAEQETKINKLQRDLDSNVATLQNDIDTKTSTIQNNINTVNNKVYLNKAVNVLSLANQGVWFKISNLFPEDAYAPNIFIISSRPQALYLLSCSRGDNNVPLTPVISKLQVINSNIMGIKAKDNVLYIQSGMWNQIQIQQIFNQVATPTITTENPPEDAVTITIK